MGQSLHTICCSALDDVEVSGLSVLMGDISMANLEPAFTLEKSYFQTAGPGFGPYNGHLNVLIS